MAASSSSSAAASPSTPPEDLEWEEWDATTSPLSFGHHCLAGSFAGVAEHTLLYPLDTVKTCWQSQVLNNNKGGVVGGGGCGEPCGIGDAFTKLGRARSAAAGGAHGVVGTAAMEPPAMMAGRAAAATENARPSMPPATSSSSTQIGNQGGIWSTMKHLMQQGQHQHHHHPVNHQISHAHVYTLAGNPPNVVDLTTANNAAAGKDASSAATPTTVKAKRPWSKRSRALRNATIEDITARGMIRASGGGGYGGYGGAIGMDAAIAQPSRGGGNNAGFKRLWRGVQTMFVGCIPAHALYFSSYEAIKSVCTDQYNSGGGESQQHQHHEGGGGHVGHDTLSPAQAMLAGGVATLLHDFVMTPMDTMKQRMQLGHYDNLRHAFVSIVYGDAGGGGGSAAATGEGWRGLYRSFPITVMTNVPYGMIMMTTNEWLRGVLEDGLYDRGRDEDKDEYDRHPFHFATILFSGMGAGTVASAATAPLDRIKTRLQTQRMGMVQPAAAGGGSGAAAAAAAAGGPGPAIMEERALAAARGEPKVCPKMAVRDVRRTLFPSSAAAAGGGPPATSIPPSVQHPVHAPRTPFRAHYATPLEAFRSILQEEGARGLFRGTLPRVALHAPSVAISWTAYETAKDWLVWMQQQQHQ